MAEVLTEDYMSSEDTDIDEAGKSANSVKELSWESRMLIKRKKAFDKFYVGQQSKRTRDRSIKRVRGSMLANRDMPEDCPEWAVLNTQEEIN